MKFTITFILLFIIGFTKAQVCLVDTTNHPMWSEESRYMHGSPGGGSYVHHSGNLITLSNDTILNSHHFFNIESQLTFSFSDYMPGTYGTNYPISNSGVKIGCLREDSSRKVWVVRYQNMYVGETTDLFNALPMDSEVLLFDFGLNVGDPSPLNGDLVVGIDSVNFLDGSLHRRINFSSGNQWIESVGSISGLFNPYSGSFGYDYWLNCFWLNGQVLVHNYYPHSIVNCNTANVEHNTTIEQTNNHNEIGISNFGHDYINVFAPSEQLIKIDFYNNVGELIKQEKFYGTESNLPVGDLMNGIYIIGLTGRSQITSYYKFVKQ